MELVTCPGTWLSFYGNGGRGPVSPHSAQGTWRAWTLSTHSWAPKGAAVVLERGQGWVLPQLRFTQTEM